MVAIPKTSSRFPLNFTGAVTLGYTDSPEVRNRMRQAAIRAARHALSVRSLPFRAHNLSPVLVIAPHPDDETLGCGGTISLFTRAGARVHVAIVSDGAASHPTHPLLRPHQIADMRRAEAIRATSILGVNPGEVSFLGAPDGKLPTMALPLRNKIVSRLASLLREIGPKAILLPCRSDGSTEHDAVFKLATMALEEARLNPRLLEYPVWAWRNPHLLALPMLLSRDVWSIDISPVSDTKAAAVDSYASQLFPIPPEERAALPPEFVAEFRYPTEFFFER
jgi:LmbE family N-acetylglucosaminyl deacetylase